MKKRFRFNYYTTGRPVAITDRTRRDRTMTVVARKAAREHTCVTCGFHIPRGEVNHVETSGSNIHTHLHCGEVL